MKTSSSYCTTVQTSTQISILNGLDAVINEVNERCMSDLVLVDKETLFSNHALFIGLTSDTVIYNNVIECFITRVYDLMFKHNVVCFVRPVIFNFDFVNKVINIVAEFD